MSENQPDATGGTVPTPLQKQLEADQNPATRDEAARVGNAARRVVIERPNARGRGRRDVHRKHQGLVRATFTPLPGRKYRLGVFEQDREYKAWVRFSSSNKRAQSDSIPDGRGLAIKLLNVAPERRPFPDPGDHPPDRDEPQTTTQDFIFLNGPAFFANKAADMVVAAELEADDKFPSSFFLSTNRLKSLAALLGMAKNQADSPVDLTYYSQTPYRLGPDLVVKYRLRPLRPRAPENSWLRKAPNYLFKALRDRLAPSQGTDVEFEFAVQVGDGSKNSPIDDASVVWEETKYPFEPVATLTIHRQIFATQRRMTFAENMSFNPWNGLNEHRPLGSINVARLVAYEASRQARQQLNSVADNQLKATLDPQQVSYGEEIWDAEAQRDQSGGENWSPEVELRNGLWQALQTFASVLPGVASLPEKLFSSPWGYGAGVFFLLVGLGWGKYQEYHHEPAWYCNPLVISLGTMPSERMIPAAKYAPKYKEYETSEAKRKADPVWVFRYAPVGAEGNGGIPYWIWRALPQMFPEKFPKFHDWGEFGLSLQDDKEYYETYHELPRGVVLAQPTANIGGNPIALDLQTVTFNCATCHRGEYTNAAGRAVFVDGMPNLGIDTAGYKRAVFHMFRDSRFNIDNVVAAINELLAEEHKKHPFLDDGSPSPSALNTIERQFYVPIVAKAKRDAWAKPLEWMEDRPDNGLGRLDAFGALRFEFLGFDPDPKGAEHIATVDLPSIWNQSWRPAHHFDGNTSDVRARNFGAIIGIGGLAISLQKEAILEVGDWIEKLAPPKDRPFGPDPTLVAAGKQTFESKCAGCHGHYDDQGELVGGPTECMKAGIDVGTDTHRRDSIQPEFVKRLNDLGVANTVWGPDAFRVPTGYLCPPLDGVWARAPYLHNGSVPTLEALLSPEKGARLERFERGNPQYDKENGGFITQAPAHRVSSLLDTRLPGNANTGHDQPDYLIADKPQRKALIAYLLTL
jgi:hypothetical protein